MDRSKVLQTSKSLKSSAPPNHFTRNVKGSSKAKKKKAKTKNMKLKRGKVLIVEGKYTTKLDQPHRKQVGKLKEKIAKSPISAIRG